jgi:Fe-S-cluster containining protein
VDYTPAVAPNVHESVRQRVLDIYRRAEADIAAAGPACIASGRCCRFKEYGHTLFLSNLEAVVLLDGAPPYDRPVSPDFCPFQKDKLCTAREQRPLGCRIYFCEPAYLETGRQLSEKYISELKRLAEELGVAWSYAPLHHFLNQPAGAGEQELVPLTGPGVQPSPPT